MLWENSVSGLRDLRQCLIEIGDQIVGVLDPDADPHKVVSDAKRGLAFVRHGKMRHRCGMAGERFRAAQADRQLRHLQRIEETEALGFAALDEDGEGAARAGAVAVVDILLARVLDHAEVAQPFDLGMVFEEVAYLLCVLPCALHPQLDRFEAAQQHPCRVGIGNPAHRVAQRADRVDEALLARHAAGDEIGMAADIFGQRIDH